MKILLDTRTFLGFIEGSPNLSNVSRNLVEDQNNQRFLSIASLWEMSIKISLGKLEMGITLTELVQGDVYGNAIDLLAIKIEHLEQLAKLPFHHKDPFDRLIIAQSLAENI